MKNRLFSAIKIVIVLFAVTGSLFLSFCKLENRDITIKLYTSENKMVFIQTYSKEAINSGNCNVIELQNIEGQSLLVNKVRFFGKSKTTVAKEISFDEFFDKVIQVENGACELTDKGLKLSGTDTIRLNMSDQYLGILKQLSSSRLQDRLLLAGFFLCFMVILFVVCCSFQELALDKTQTNHHFLFELKKFFGHLLKYRNYIDFSAKADLNAEVANSYLNRFWWILEPFFNMMIYVIVFGRVMGRSVQNYATFVFSALLMWNYFSKTINYSVKLVRNNRDIVTKVYVPKFVLLMSNMILNFYKLLFSLSILVVMLFIFRVHVGICIFGILPAYALMILLSFGIGMIFLHFGVYVDDLAYAAGIMLNMLMFLSGIFYNVFTSLPEPLNILMITLNPVALFIDIMRNALLYNSIVHLPLLWLWLLASVIMCYIGIHVVYKNENSYVKIV